MYYVLLDWTHNEISFYYIEYDSIFTKFCHVRHLDMAPMLHDLDTSYSKCTHE